MLVTLNKCFVPTAKFSTSRFFTTFVNQQTKQLTVNSLFGSIVIDKARFRECHTSNFQPSKGIQSNISALKMKKKPVRKKRVLTNTDVIEPGVSILFFLYLQIKLNFNSFLQMLCFTVFQSQSFGNS